MWSPKGTTLRVIRCPTLQVSQFPFPGQRSDTFLTDHVFYKLTGWLGVLICRHTSVMRYPPARRSRSPYYTSAGHRLFSLRTTLSRGRGWSSGFEWDSSFVRCLILLARMISCTVGIPRSLWIISLVTCRGASTVALSMK